MSARGAGGVETSLIRSTAEVVVECIGDRDPELVISAIRFLQKRDGEVGATALRDPLPDPPPQRETLRLVRHLQQWQFTGPDAIPRRTRALREVDSAAQLLSGLDGGSAPTLVATIPSDGAIDAEGFSDLLTEVLEVIKQAESNLWIVSPFLSGEAFDRLRPALLTAADRGAEVNLLTRYLTYGGEDGEFNRAFTRRALNDPRIGPVLQVYEYVDDETWMTFHAKVIIADESEAYLGTANVTGRGFLNNLELGVIFSGHSVEDLSALFESMKSSEHLHEVSAAADGFRRV